MLTVISWNVDGWHTIRDAQVELSDASGAELALLQEVTPESAKRLRLAGWEIVTALELLPPDHVERAGRRPRFSCAVATRGALTIAGAEVLTDAPSPVRTLVARITRPDGDGAFTAMSAALPPGSMWGRQAKQGQARVIGANLAALDGPVIVGMDRNGPKHERFDPSDTEWWPEDEPALFAADAPHGLRDVLLTLHAEHPGRREAARAERPDGPLEVSYIEQRTTPPSPRRYDVILASANWNVKDITYDYGASVAAGSDHSRVIAGFESRRTAKATETQIRTTGRRTAKLCRQTRIEPVRDSRGASFAHVMPRSSGTRALSMSALQASNRRR